MTTIIPIRTAPAVKRVKTKPQNFEKVKSFFPNVEQKVLYCAAGAGSPPPGDGDKFINKLSLYTPEEIARIILICKGNNFRKKSLIMNNNSKYLKI